MSQAFEQEELLERFRGWLAQVGDEAREAAGDEAAEDAAPLGYRELVEQFTALRHEVKLQTKGARQTQELAEGLCAAMDRALEQWKLPPPAAEPSAEVLDGLMNLDDALERGRRAVDQARRRIVEESARELDEALARAYAEQSFWRRWAARPFQAAVRAALRRQAEQTHRAVMDALAEGYRLIQARLNKVLLEQELERIECLGQPADPHAVTVVEVVAADLPAGTVVEEVRRGYRWRGRVVRFAEVRAVARAAAESPAAFSTQERIEDGDRTGD